MIQKQINKLSKNEKIFNESVSIYQEVLTKSNFKHELEYKEDKNSQCKKTQNRKRKIIFLTHHSANQLRISLLLFFIMFNIFFTIFQYPFIISI